MKILVAGDFCPRARIVDCIDVGKYELIFSEVKEQLADMDYSIVNLECPVSDGTGKIAKCGPNHRCSEKSLDALEWAGFDCVTLANNHFLDFGQSGVSQTLKLLDKKGINHVGGGLNLQQASKILYKEINGETLAIINCCEEEFSIATENSAGANPINPISQYYDIKAAKENSDYVLVIYHGGHEHFQYPSMRMKKLFHFFIDCGADAVICHHQHCFSGYETYRDKPISYGLGNFCFDNPSPRHGDIWYYGYMVKLSFSKQEIGFEIIPYNQCSASPTVKMIELSSIEDSLNQINQTISDNVLLKKKVDQFYDGLCPESNMMMEPISNRYVRALQRRHFLPHFKFNKRHILRMYNFLACESQWDIIKYWLSKEYKKL